LERAASVAGRIADRPIATEIARNIFIELRCAARHRPDDLRYCRQEPGFDA
jgi:hypothetical protein